MEFRRQNRRRKLVTWVPAFSVAAAAGNRVAGVDSKRSAETGSGAGCAAVHAVAPVAEEETDGFYPLPEAEALPAVENAMVVRVQLPVSSLQLMGVPVE